MPKVRVATVRATGRRYAVDRISFARKPGDIDRAYLRGEVVAYARKGRVLQATHAREGMALPLAEVEVAEVEATVELYRELLAQNAEVLREAGHVVERRGRNYVDRGTEEQADVVRRAAEALDAGLRGDPFVAKAFAAYARGRSAVTGKKF